MATLPKPNHMKRIDAVTLYITLRNMGQKPLPISRHTASACLKLKPIFEDYEERRKVLLENCAEMDDGGEPLGRMDDEGDRIKKPATISDIEWRTGKQKEYRDEMKALGNEVVGEELTFDAADCNRTVYESSVKKERKIGDILTERLGANDIEVLLEYGIIENYE